MIVMNSPLRLSSALVHQGDVPHVNVELDYDALVRLLPKEVVAVRGEGVQLLLDRGRDGRHEVYRVQVEIVA
jgi:hypothetical protein